MAEASVSEVCAAFVTIFFRKVSARLQVDAPRAISVSSNRLPLLGRSVAGSFLIVGV